MQRTFPHTDVVMFSMRNEIVESKLPLGRRFVIIPDQ